MTEKQKFLVKPLRQVAMTADTIEMRIRSENFSNKEIFEALEDLDYFYQKLRLTMGRGRKKTFAKN
jgi:hypothetical protein